MDCETRSDRAMADGFMPVWNDARIRFALPAGTLASEAFTATACGSGTSTAGLFMPRRLISAPTASCSVSSSISWRPCSVAERFLGSVTLGGASGSFTDVEPANSGAWGRDAASVDFGSAIAATVPHGRDRSNVRLPFVRLLKDRACFLAYRFRPEQETTLEILRKVAAG